MPEVAERAPPEKVAVLGAGMLGLTLALRLANAGKRVTVYEGAEQIGGLTRYTNADGVMWDSFYHVIDASDVALLDLLQELGIENDVQWRTTNTLFFDGQQHYPLNNALDYLRLPALSLLGKIRVAANIVYAGARNRRGGLESLSAEQWLSRWSGRAAYSSLWAPLLRSKLGTNFNKVSAAYIWAVIRRFYGAREGSQRTERFGFMPGGYARVLQVLLDELSRRGVVCITAHPIDKLGAAEDNGVLVSSCGTQRRFDQAVVTYASPLFARACPQLSASQRERHEDLAYQGVVCLSALLTRPLGGGYMTYITDESVPFTTVIEMSALTGSENFGGHHLAYLPRYVPSDDPLLDKDDDHVATQFFNGLKRLYPDFDRTQVASFHVARARYVMTVPVCDYSSKLPDLNSGIDGLTVCNSAHIVDASLSVNEAVALADRVAPVLVSDG